MDYCCETDCGPAGSEPYGGPRLCEESDRRAPPAKYPLATKAPVYEAPATSPPATEAPVYWKAPPTKYPPATKAPVYEAPATSPPATKAPVYEAPATKWVAPTVDKCVGDCAFCKPHDEVDMPLCSNGEYQWACVSGGRGHRVQCPSVAPMMCAHKKCDGGMDYCCETDCGPAGSEPYGGPRLCQVYKTPAKNLPTIATIPPTTEAPPVYKLPAFCKPHDGTDMPLCSNGEYQWACVSGGRGHRVQCPSVAPTMCAYKKCDGGMDYCCETDCGPTGSEPYGGPRGG